jgi:zinc/manganese transport system substrate-binding protein
MNAAMRTLCFGAALAALAGAPALGEDVRKVRVLTTTTDLREIAREVGGDAVEVDCLTRGPEDPHFLDARPSFVRLAHDADLFVKVGMDMEIGYEVPIVRDARNPRIQPGRPGYCDASRNVPKLEVPAGEVTRALGDVHAQGNPHYMLDPVRAKVVAASVADSLAAVDPPRAAHYRGRAEDFGKRIDAAMFGEAILADVPSKRLERYLAEGRLGAFLREKGLESKLGGWAKELLPFSGAKIVGYHGNFNYLAARFRLEVAAQLEPKPGIPPTPQHLKSVVERMRAEGMSVVVFTPYQPKAVPERVAEEATGRAVRLAHMPGALPGTDDYFACIGADVRALAGALRAATEGR